MILKGRCLRRKGNTGEDNAVGGKAEAEEMVAELPPESPTVKALKKVRNVGPADGKRMVKSVPSVSLLQIFSDLINGYKYWFLFH